MKIVCCNGYAISTSAFDFVSWYSQVCSSSYHRRVSFVLSLLLGLLLGDGQWHRGVPQAQAVSGHAEVWHSHADGVS